MEKDRAKLLNQPRRRKKTKITWVSTSYPRVPSKTAIIKTNFNLLHAHVVNKVIFNPRTIILVDRKRKQILHKHTSLLFHRDMSSMGPRTDQGFFLAKKRATLVTIQKKPLFLYLCGMVDTGPSSSTSPVQAQILFTSLCEKYTTSGM